MEEQIEAFVEYLATEKHYSANTLGAYRNDLIQFSQFLASVKPPRSSWRLVDATLIQAYLTRLEVRGLKPASIARKIAAIRSFYYYLYDQNGLTLNPTLNLTPPPSPKRIPESAPSEDVLGKLLSVDESTPRGLRDRAIIAVLYAAGLRVTELTDLNIQAVDWKAGALRIGAKGSGRARSIPLGPSALVALEAYRVEARPALKAEANSGPLFVNTRGERLSRQGVWLIIKEYAKRAGISDTIGPYILRHSFASRQLARGEKVEELQRMLGHAHISTTRTYSRLHGTELLRS